MRFCLFLAIFILGYSAYSYTASAIIYNAQIITMSDKGIISDGTIVIKDDKIVDNDKLVKLNRKFIGYDLEGTKKRFNKLFSKIEPVANELSKAAFKKQNENENKAY